MNKNVLIGAIIAVVVVAGGAIFYMNMNGSGNSSSSSSDSSSVKSGKKYSAIKACDLFTLAEARQLMGVNAGDGVPSPPPSTDDVSVDTCSYSNNAKNVSEMRIATIMVRAALTDVGMDSNKDAFKEGGAAYPAGATTVEGYGEKAYWDNTTRQLAILKDNVWIGIVYGDANPSTNTLDDAKKVADLVAK